ncbi:MAG: hypothetical protein J2P28_22945, partial [Actinobacteria bacterium]|nr:hypothetical protein [Actinomycetota bacterium]
AAIAAMPKARRSRYERLAVFAGRGAFPADAVQALWRRTSHSSAPIPLLDEFVRCALLTSRGAGWYSAHDLQNDFLKKRLGDVGLAAAHARLLDGYRVRYRRGWTESADDPYLSRNLAGHLRDAGLSDELRAVLTSPEWIQARLAGGPAHELIHDYRHMVDPLTRQVMRTLRLQAPSLVADPELVRPQLTSRLLSHPDPGITAWAAGLNRDGDGSVTAAVKPTRATTPANPPQHILTGHTGPVRSVAVSRDGTQAVSGSDDGTVRVWDLTTGTQRATLTGHTDWVRAVAISPDGTQAVSGSDDGTVRVWDLTTGTQRATLTGHQGEVFAVAITSAGDRAVSGGSDRILRIWDLGDGSERTILAGHTRPVWSVAIMADDTHAVSASGDGTVRLWDLDAKTERATLTGHDGEVFAVAITPDGDRAVSGGGDGTIRQWSMPAGQPDVVLTGHTGWVRAVRLAYDKLLAVSGGEDASVRVWDLATGTERATLTGHHREVFAVAITPDGRRVISGGGDETVRVWDLREIGNTGGPPHRRSGPRHR